MVPAGSGPCGNTSTVAKKRISLPATNSVGVRVPRPAPSTHHQVAGVCRAFMRMATMRPQIPKRQRQRGRWPRSASIPQPKHGKSSSIAQLNFDPPLGLGNGRDYGDPRWILSIIPKPGRARSGLRLAIKDGGAASDSIVRAGIAQHLLRCAARPASCSAAALASLGSAPAQSHGLAPYASTRSTSCKYHRNRGPCT